MKNTDGTIIIGTKLDSSDLDKQLKDQQRRLAQYEKEAERLTTAKARARDDLAPYYEQVKILEQERQVHLKNAKSQLEKNVAMKHGQRTIFYLNKEYEKALVDVFSADKEFLDYALNEVKAKYGSVENYLVEALEVDIDKFRKIYLK